MIKTGGSVHFEFRDFMTGDENSEEMKETWTGLELKEF